MIETKRYNTTARLLRRAFTILALLAPAVYAVAPPPPETITIGGTSVVSVANLGNTTVPQLLTGQTVITGKVSQTSGDFITFTLPPGKAVVSGMLVVSNYIAPPPGGGPPMGEGKLSYSSSSAFSTTSSLETDVSVAVTAPTRRNTNTFTISLYPPYQSTMGDPLPPDFFPSIVTTYGSANYVLTLEIGDQDTSSTLGGLSGSNVTLSPPFSPAITVYEGTIPFSQGSVTLNHSFSPVQVLSVKQGNSAFSSFTQLDTSSTSYQGFISAVGEPTPFTYRVYAQDGTQTDYTVNITRQPNVPPANIPTVGIVVADTSLTVGETSTVTFTFNVAVSGFTLADILVPNGFLTGLSTVDGVTFTSTLTPSANIADGTNVISLDLSGVKNATNIAGSGIANSNNYAVNTVGANVAPTDITLSNSTIAENNAPGATVGTFTAVDANAGDTHTFTLDYSTEMAVDNGAFTIVGNALKLNASADFETKSDYYIQVKANDGNGGEYSAPFTISITDVNEVTGPTVGATTGGAVPGEPVGTTYAGVTGLPGADEGDIGATNVKLPNGKTVKALVNSSGIIIKVGDQLVGAGNAEIAKLDSMSFGVFQAELKLGTGTPAVTTATNKVVCFEDGSGVQVLARSGQAAPGGSTFKSFRGSCGDAAGNVFIAGILNDGTSVDGGLWAIPAGGALTLLVKEGQMLNLGNGPKRVNAISSFPVGVKSQAEGRVHYGTDSVITRITLGADHAIVTIPADSTGIADWTVIAQTNGDAPGAIGKYLTLGLPAAEGTNVVFTAVLKTAGTVTTANNRIVVAGGAVIAREGDAAPGTSGTFTVFEDVAAGITGQASFTANISGATTATDNGLWEYRSSTLSLVARQGDAAPDLSGVTIAGISRFAQPGGGLGPVFTATLGGATATTNVGLFGVPSTGGSALNLARTGDLFDIGGTIRKLTSISALKMDLGNEGVARGYTDTSVFMIGGFGTRTALIEFPVASEAP